MYIVIGIIAFGLLIMIHELGHFTAAKLSDVKVSEFAIGMGPALFKKQGKETQYSLRLLPFGGFCAMEEDEESDDPRAFVNKTWWKKLIILAAGSLSNFVAGFLIVLILTAAAPGLSSAVLDGFMTGYQFQGENGLMAGDRIVSINGESVHNSGDISLILSRSNGKTANLKIKRGGIIINYKDFPMYLQEFETDSGTVMRYGLYFKTEENSFFGAVRYSWYEAANFVRLVRFGLSDLFTGSAGLKDFTGPVGVVAIMNEMGSSASSSAAGLRALFYFCAFIAVNLSVMNMLPIPALDGGRILFMFITMFIEKITRRKLNRKYEGYIHGVCLVLLLCLMAFTLYNDISRLL